MDFKEYSDKFTAKAYANGYSSEVVLKCLNYSAPLFENNLPVIYDSSHLAGLVGYKESYLQRAIIFTHHFYRKFKIKKANGEFRHLAEPLPSLKEVQCWILENVLYKIEVSRFAKAYIKGTTLKQNLVFHRNQPIVLSLDIKVFFSSIKKPRIKELFKKFGYSSSVSDLLSKLCCLNDKLPQGASTSPYLSNLIMSPFDESISQHCLKNKIRYTRYADDITFSGEFDSSSIICKVREELAKLELELNEDKIKIMKKGQRQAVTRIVVNEKIQVNRMYRKEIRQSIYYVRKFGIISHLSKIGSKKSNYLQHLLGKILHVLFINPEDKEFEGYKKYVNTLREKE